MTDVSTPSFPAASRRLAGTEFSIAVDSPRDYWQEAMCPWVILWFMAPLVLLYELATAASGASATRNAAELWLRQGLIQCGLHQVFALPTIVLLWLLVWQIVQKHPWRLRASTLAGVAGESFIFALLLIVLGQTVQLSLLNLSPPVMEIEAPNVSGHWLRYVGAGIYEEIFFRALLLPLGYASLRLCMLPVRPAWIVSIVVSSSLFATAHYLQAGSETFVAQDLLQAADRIMSDPSTWFGWWYRMAAGVVFSLLFLLRGLAIAVGSHVGYDLLVGVVLETLFTQMG